MKLKDRNKNSHFLAKAKDKIPSLNPCLLVQPSIAHMATTTLPRLNHVFHLRGHMGKDTINAGQHRSGPHRHITALEGGFLRGIPGSRGESLDATLVAGGSDWILFDESTNTAHLDVRTQGRTKDGECVYIHYNGYLQLDDDAQKFMSWSPEAETTEYGKHHWWSAPNIEISGMFRLP